MVYPTRKLPFEELTTIDERVDFVHNQLVRLELAVNTVLEKMGEPTMIAVTREVVLTATLPPGSGVIIRKPSPLMGRITQIIPHWPGGCNALVDIAFGHKDTWVMPSEVDTFVALDNATPIIQVNENIDKGEELWMNCRNRDAVNPHTVSVTLTIIGE